MQSETDSLRKRIDCVRERMARACEKAGRPPASVRLVAVTKNFPAETVQALIDCGIHDIGENRVQEIEDKAPHLKGAFSLHMIGHLQSNKAAKVLPLVKWIHSVDREKLISRIEAGRSGGEEKTAALVEVNTTGEPFKSGCRPEECAELCERVRRSGKLEFRGLMTVGPLEGGEKAARESFALLRRLGEECRGEYGTMELSMGMSGDFEWAIAEGATMVRVGTLLLGERKA